MNNKMLFNWGTAILWQMEKNVLIIIKKTPVSFRDLPLLFQFPMFPIDPIVDNDVNISPATPTTERRRCITYYGNYSHLKLYFINFISLTMQ